MPTNEADQRDVEKHVLDAIREVEEATDEFVLDVVSSEHGVLVVQVEAALASLVERRVLVRRGRSPVIYRPAPPKASSWWEAIGRFFGRARGRTAMSLAMHALGPNPDLTPEERDRLQKIIDKAAD